MLPLTDAEAEVAADRLTASLDRMGHSCVLDFSEQANNLIEVARILGVSRERVRQIEAEGLGALEPKAVAMELEDGDPLGWAAEREANADRKRKRMAMLNSRE